MRRGGDRGVGKVEILRSKWGGGEGGEVMSASKTFSIHGCSNMGRGPLEMRDILFQLYFLAGSPTCDVIVTFLTYPKSFFYTPSNVLA